MFSGCFSVGSTDSGCSGVFGHTQLLYSIIISIFGLAKFLVPLWTLLCVFQPLEDRSRASEVALATSYNMVSFSQVSNLNFCVNIQQLVS